MTPTNQEKLCRYGSVPKLNRWLCLIGFLATLGIAGCAMPETAPDQATTRALLQPWMDVTGAQPGANRFGPPGMGYITLQRPTAVSARDNEVFLIDAGLKQIFRYNRNQMTLIPFTNLPANADMSIYEAPDRSVYIADPTRSELLHFASDGTQLPSFVAPGNLARPVSVAVDERSGQVLVADGLFHQFITFSSLGMTLSVVRPQQPIAIAAMATGPDGIYVADRVGRRIVVLGQDGVVRYTLGDKNLGVPIVIAVSRDNLVFVGDNFDQTIKVFQNQKTGTPAGDNGILAATVGGVGAAPGRFNGISGLAVDGNMLYVSDSLNARVQIMLINR